jgi:CheY-like chemotaxis protein
MVQMSLIGCRPHCNTHFINSECGWTLAGGNGPGNTFACCQKERLDHENAPTIQQSVILLIEDDAEDIELFRLALAQTGSPYRVVAVQFAKDAINYLLRLGVYQDEKLSPKPSLIVLDLSLPGMSGLEFLTWAKCEPPESIPPIVVLSYSKIELDRQVTQKLGAKAYFVKSPNLHETVAMTKNLLLLNVSPSTPTEPNQNPSRQNSL